jgi:hypothetical protein
VKDVVAVNVQVVAADIVQVPAQFPDAPCNSLVNVPVPGVVDPMLPGAVKFRPAKVKDDAVRFATAVVDETTSGAVPVETVDVNCGADTPPVPVYESVVPLSVSRESGPTVVDPAAAA